MDETTFMSKYRELLDKDSPRSGTSANSRTFLDREADVLGKHLWELFTSHASGDLSESWLIQALLKTKNKHDSCQDQAAAIMALRGTVKTS